MREANRFVAARPMKSRLEHHFFFRIALRPIKSGSSLGLSKDVRDAVIADAIAGTEVGMRVVVESTPADVVSNVWASALVRV